MIRTFGTDAATFLSFRRIGRLVSWLSPAEIASVRQLHADEGSARLAVAKRGDKQDDLVACL
jgi:hypothetical protein